MNDEECETTFRSEKNIMKSCTQTTSFMYMAAWLRDEESDAAITTSGLAVWINGNVLLSIGRELRAWIAEGGDATSHDGVLGISPPMSFRIQSGVIA